MNRKNFFLLLWPLLLPLCVSAQTGRPRCINIWQGTTVGKTVVMTSYLAEGKDNAAVIVCPGGSYLWHDMGGEGKDVGEWLQRNGISAFVLRYRTAGVGAFLTPYRYVFRGNRYPDALNDLLRAMQYVKAHSAELGVDASRVAAMGFSAGGHLVMSAAELLPREQRPWFVVPVYPVVTMTEACVHRRSRRALLGDSRLRSRQLRDLLSLERHVPADCRRYSWSTAKTTRSWTVVIPNCSIRHSHGSRCPTGTYSIRRAGTASERLTIRVQPSAGSGKKNSWRGSAGWKRAVRAAAGHGAGSAGYSGTAVPKAWY